MSAYMPHPMQPHDPELDRALALARTPQVPESLAARIARDVARLPQDPTPIRAAEPVAETARPTRGWLRVAGFAALTLITGAAAATFLLQNGSGNDRPARQLAAIDQPNLAVPATRNTAQAPAAATAELVHADAPASDSTEPAVKSAVPPAKSPAAQQAPIEFASEAVVPSPVINKPSGVIQSGMAQNGPIDIQPNSGALAPTASTYGPPAGFGISNGGGMSMPENQGQSTMPRGGTPTGMPSGGMPMPSGGMGGGPGGGGGGMHPRH